MRNRVMLAPSVMCIPAWDGRKDLEMLKDCGAALLHADVMDGEFVPNLMLGTEAIRHLRRISPVPLDIHLMIERPEDKLAWFEPQPGEYVSVHVESTRHLQRALSRIRDCGAKPVAALNPGTPLCMIEDVLPDVEAVLLMTVNPGFAGQRMVPQTLEKIARLRRMLDRNGLQHVRIEADGNVSFETAGRMRAAGVDTFVCGTSSLFAKGRTVEENAAKLKRILAEAEQAEDFLPNMGADG